MDKLLYIATSGAKQDLLATAVRANNLANANTTGFKAHLEQARAMPAFGEGLPTRVFAMTETPGINHEAGPMEQTGRDLDVAIQGRGFFAVLDANGQEAYTRNGRLDLNNEGQLVDSYGNPLLGEVGPVTVPIPISNLNIATDGTVAFRPQGAPVTVLEEAARIRLVKPEERDLVQGEDGLFRLQNGQQAAFDPDVRVATGMLEGSNVDPVEEMVSMINLQRHYELQVKMMKKADSLDTRANSLLRII